MDANETTTVTDQRDRFVRSPEELRDAQVTRRLVRVGIGAACFLLAWIPVVFLGFRG